MARAVLFAGFGEPLELVRFPTPEPRGAEVLVRITCCTLCRSDLHTHAGRRNEATPTVLGHEIVGRIEAFGPEAVRVDAAGTPAAVGTRVTWAIAAGCSQCFFCTHDLPQKCERPYKYGHTRATRDLPLGGGLADYVMLVPGTAWYVVPDEIPDRVAAPANCAVATVAALMRYAGPITGRRVLVLGAGVLGVTVCVMARAAGARLVMASDPVPASRERALAFGATHALPTGDELTAHVADLTSDRGADVVFELAGHKASAQASLALARTGGTVILAGAVAPIAPLTIDPEKIVRRMLTIRGVHNYHPHDLHTALRFLAGPGRQYPFESLIDAEFSLDAIESAFARAHASAGRRVAVIP